MVVCNFSLGLEMGLKFFRNIKSLFKYIVFKMILRLKREVQSLKDELALVTGEQRTDDLTQDEIERCLFLPFSQ